MDSSRWLVAVDDHLMRTTHVVRGDEWMATLPFHIQLFKALGFKLPKYVHIGPLMKMDGNSKRKLSKRKDPELALTYYKAEGFPIKAMQEYMMTVLNSSQAHLALYLRKCEAARDIRALQALPFRFLWSRMSRRADYFARYILSRRARRPQCAPRLLL